MKRTCAIIIGAALLAFSSYVGTACLAHDFGFLASGNPLLTKWVLPLAKAEQLLFRAGIELKSWAWHTIAIVPLIVGLLLLYSVRKRPQSRGFPLDNINNH